MTRDWHEAQGKFTPQEGKATGLHSILRAIYKELEF